MPINFIPNDPLAQVQAPMRRKAARPDRPPRSARLTFAAPVTEGPYAPGTPEFLYWQSREAALAAIATWEDLHGRLARWSSGVVAKKLALIPIGGDDLNAYYNRKSLSFFQHQSGTKQTFSGASTDVVAHETGHALLDSIRPDLWASAMTEPGAFHEAFGDCMALLTSLNDRTVRMAVLQVAPDLGAANFLEATAEDLSDGVKRDPRYGPTHPAAAPRHARNSFQWQLPSTLPTSGGPTVLTSEVHSFARIFTGCFYDTLRTVFLANPKPRRTEAALLAAAKTVGKLLIGGATQAPASPRFFQEVGQGMIRVDQATNAGLHTDAIVGAFSGHGIDLAVTTVIAPTAALTGSAPRRTRGRGYIAADTRRDLLQRIAAEPSAGLAISTLETVTGPVHQATHEREVALGTIHPALRGAVALVPEPVLIGTAGTHASILGALPDATTTADEVRAFVTTLVAHGHIELKDSSRTAKRRSLMKGARSAVALPDQAITGQTHAIRIRGGKRILTRLRFAHASSRS